MLRRINSRYNGRCKICRGRITVGQSIYWSKATGSQCVSCTEGKKESPKPETENKPVKARRLAGWSRFTVDWSDLKETALKALKGDTSDFKNPLHKSEALRAAKGGSWQGFTSGQLERWLKEGFQTEAIKGLSEFTPPIREKRRLQFNEEEGELLLDVAWSGGDNYFAEWTKRQVIPGLAVEATITFQAGVSPIIVGQYLTWLNKAIYSLETSGVDCEISLAVVGDGLWSGGKAITTIRVKRENEVGDYLSWSPMISPAGLRGLGFLAFYLHCEEENKTAAGSLGHGRIPATQDWGISWDSERRVLEINAHYDAREFPEERMTNQLREVLKGMRG